MQLGRISAPSTSHFVEQTLVLTGGINTTLYHFVEQTLVLTAGLGTAFFSVLLKECSILFRSFFEFLATYETQKNVTFFFSTERKRLQRTQHSLTKNVKERENVSLFCKRMQNIPFYFQYIYI